MEESFWEANNEWIAALITMAVTFTIAFLVDRFVIGRGARVARRIGEGGVSRATATRLRVIRRLVFAIIIVIGVALALSQFKGLNKLAAGLLASSAVLGIVLGLAARAVLANPLAGIQLAVTQPIRIGDSVTINDETGRVADVTLAHTFLDTGDGRLVIVPNETVITSVVVNHSTGDPSAPPAVSVWLPPDGDVGAARAALAPLELSQIELAEITPDGIRVELHGPRHEAGTGSGGEQAALRERAHRALREAGLLASG